MRKIFALALLFAAVHPPATKKIPVTDTYFNIKIVDPYRWLENADDPAVKQWVEEQNRYARSVLDAIPQRAAIEKRLVELTTDRPPSYGSLVQKGGHLFALKFQPPKEQPFLVTLNSINDKASERVVIDPVAIDPSGHTEIDFFVPSNDGKLVAVSLSHGGSESGDVHVYDVATGKELGDAIARVNGGTAGGDVAWNRDSSGFFYTRYPREGERPQADIDFYQQVWFHKLGAPVTEDHYEIGKDFPRIAETSLDISPDGHALLASVRNGDGGEVEHFVRGDDGAWRQITHFNDAVPQVRFGEDGNLYELSHKNAPNGKIVSVEGQTIVPQSNVAIESFLPTERELYVNYMAGGPSELRMTSIDGAKQTSVPILPVSAVNGLVPLGGDTIAFTNGSYLEPANWYTFAPGEAKPNETALKITLPVSFADTVVDRVMVTSKDGAKVPLNIIHRKDMKLGGANPTLLTGYGGYNISLKPGFNATRRLWLDAGGVYAIANLRGGGEFGESWHEQGKLTQKQNVFDDFAACARYLIAHSYTSPSHLAIEGGSNGGLLMGAALTQHPELFRAVVSHVGIYDMLRVELSPNGAFNVTEFGTVKNPEQFRALYAYSPYHHVVDGTKYPAVLMLTGANDPRVDPMNSRKMVARLQAANASTHPILLRASSSSGHGIGTSFSEAIAQQTDVDAFLFHELGMK
ncbi:MAG TPA: prolyl oligopeptidase family serine peptidase [Thermoanaerobaculia bacterium]|nr:prolyl oligopeptidase family serine peptidase [Thermoanaerobaculia bacterium]